MPVDQFFSPFTNIYLNIAALVVFWTLLFKLLIDKTRKDPRLCKLADTLPGPFALPIVGNGAEFLLAGKDGIQELLMNYTRKYGTLYKLWIGKDLVVAVSDVEYLETIFRTPKALGKPKIFRAFHELLGDALFTAPMHVWSKTRKRIQPFFSKNAVKLEVPLINETIHKYVELLRKHVDGPTFDLYDYLPYLAVDSFLKIYLDLELNDQERRYYDFHRMAHFFVTNGVFRMFVPWLKYNRTVSHYKTAAIVERTQNFKGLIDREKLTNLDPQKTFTRETTMGNSVDDFPNRGRDLRGIRWDSYRSNSTARLRFESTLISSQNVAKDIDLAHVLETFSNSFFSSIYRSGREMALKNYLYDETTNFTVAASDTSALTNGFFLLAVAMHPEIQDRLYAEIFNVFGPDDRPATVEDFQRLPYFDQVLKESQRYFTIIPFVMRGVEEDLEIGSLIFPAGTTLLVHIKSVHCNPDLYPDPMNFNPENFSPEAVSRRSKYSFIPFSAGTRNCVAQNYAEVNVKLTLIALLRNFTFYTNEKFEDVKRSGGFTSGKVGGFPVTIKFRV